MTPGGMPSPPTKQIVVDKRYEALVGEGDWEMILNVMVWSEGPTWWQDKLVFSDTRLEKIYSWDPKTELTDVVLEKAGYGIDPVVDTHLWMEPGSNGLAANPHTGELVICQHGSRALAALSPEGVIRKLVTKTSHGPLNSPNDVAVHKTTGDIFFTDPVFGKQTVNNNLIRGNMGGAPELDTPGFSGVYRYNPKTEEVTLINNEMQQPNGIGITPDNELIVAYCNETVWQWWKWQLDEDGSVAGEKTIFIDGKETMSGPGYPDGLHIDGNGNIWVTGPGGFYIYDKNGVFLGGEQFTTIATSNILVAPDGYIYVTGNHGVYRKPHASKKHDEL